MGFYVKHLLKGCESPERFKLILKLTGLRSVNLIDGLTDHYTKGHSIAITIILNDISRSKFDRAVLVLNRTVKVIQLIKDIDWGKCDIDHVKRFELILSLTSLRSQPVIAALQYHHGQCKSRREAYRKFKVNSDKFDRGDMRIKRTCKIIEKLKRIDSPMRYVETHTKKLDPLDRLSCALD